MVSIKEEEELKAVLDNSKDKTRQVQNTLDWNILRIERCSLMSMISDAPGDSWESAKVPLDQL